MNETVNVTRRELKSSPKYRGTVMVEADIAYPRVTVAGGERAGQHISGHYAQVARRQYAHATGRLYAQAVQGFREAKKNGYPFHPYSSAMAFETPFNHGGLLSIYYDQYTYTGGAHGNTVRTADTWRVWDARRLPLEAFFYGEGYLDVIYRSILAQIAQHPEYYFEDAQKNVREYFDPRQFYLTPQGFVFFFQLYTIAPYATGMPSFLVPYELFGELLRIRPV